MIKRILKKLGIFSKKDLMFMYSNGFAHGNATKKIELADNSGIDFISKKMSMVIDAYIKH